MANIAFQPDIVNGVIAPPRKRYEMRIVLDCRLIPVYTHTDYAGGRAPAAFHQKCHAAEAS